MSAMKDNPPPPDAKPAPFDAFCDLATSWSVFRRPKQTGERKRTSGAEEETEARTQTPLIRPDCRSNDYHTCRS